MVTMGIYINTGNAGFQRARNSEYIDKSGLITVINSTLFTERSFSCVTRCRRFGKSMADYINMNYEGLKDDVIYMLAGGRCPVDPTGFQNDMSTIRSKNDVLTALIHLGYLGYDWREDECYIPNREVAGEMAERLLLVGISYNRQTKTHDCQIEQSKA